MEWLPPQHHMSEKTFTQTAIEQPVARARRKPLTGLVVVFSEPGAHAPAMALTKPLRAGRDKSADWIIADPKVSRQHALFEPTLDGALVSDLDSHNGTWIDGVEAAQPKTFAPAGSLVRMGKTLVLVVDDVESFRDYPPLPEEPLIGGPRISELRWQIETLARAPSPVLITGETGTGKERAAQAVHKASRRPGRFVAVNCAAIPKDLVESELFGHARGAFSGAQAPRQGLFRSADGGTLLLDEIGELPLPLQAKLLRVVEDGEVRPVGDDAPTMVDVRIVAATNRSLDAMVEAGGFREDLLHRLAASRISMPPLRERIEDVPLLTAYFLTADPLPFSVAAMEQLLRWQWPGNVRELRHSVLSAAAAARAQNAERVSPEHVPASVGQTHKSALPAQRSGGDADEVLRARIITALTLRAGNVAQVARDLGMRRPGLYEAFARLRIDPAQYRKG